MVIGFISCKKEPLEPANPQTTVNNPANVNPIGYTWELYSGRVYVKNLDNGSTPRNYSLSSIVGNNNKSLSLYSFTTLGGDWSGQVQGTFINDWVINNALFTNMFVTTPDARIWVVRIL